MKKNEKKYILEILTSLFPLYLPLLLPLLPSLFFSLFFFLFFFLYLTIFTCKVLFGDNNRSNTNHTRKRELIAMPPAPASAPPMSNLERCIARSCPHLAKPCVGCVLCWVSSIVCVVCCVFKIFGGCLQDFPSPGPPRPPDRPKFRSFFSLPPEISFFLLSLGGLLVEFWWCF